MSHSRSSAVTPPSERQIQSIKPSRLTLRYGEEIRDVIPGSDQILIGRAEQCDLVVDDLYASRMHAVIQFAEGTFQFADESTNGTFFSTEYYGEIHLLRGSLVLIGEGRFSVGKPLHSADRNVIHFFCR